MSQDWSNGLLDCGPMGTCCAGYWCPCILVGRSADRIHDFDGENAHSCNSDCVIFGVLQYTIGCGWIYGMIKRKEIRNKYDIEGNGMDDYCISYWCGCCAVIQQEKETVRRSEPDTSGYQQMDSMNMHAMIGTGEPNGL